MSRPNLDQLAYYPGEFREQAADKEEEMLDAKHKYKSFWHNGKHAEDLIGESQSARPMAIANGRHSPSAIFSKRSSSQDSLQSGQCKSYVDKRVALYKTEMCRAWEETGKCKYGDRCQFAHSVDELRIVSRHPKYKTEICRTFWEDGTCPYGKRCCFIHNEIGSPLKASFKLSDPLLNPNTSRRLDGEGVMICRPNGRPTFYSTEVNIDDSLHLFGDLLKLIDE